MSRLKYVYTPRRRQRRPVRSLSAFALAPVLIAIVFGAYWLAKQGDGKPERAVAVLTSECAPDQGCSSAGLAQQAAGGGAPSRRRDAQPDGAAAPAITGLAAAVLEEPCGATLYQLNGDMHTPPASLTKIATALVAAERSDLSQAVTITVNGGDLSAETDSTVMGLKPDQRLSMRELLYGLLLPSGNDAAIQIAQTVAGDVPDFVRLMNDKASQLGLKDTHFTNPHGLDDPAHYTSAHDIAVLGRELLRRPALAQIVRTPAYQPAWDGPALKNLNQLLNIYPGAIGVKTGYTDQAGQTIVAAAEQDGRQIIVSVLGSQTDIYQDTVSLLDWAFQGTAPACAPGGQKQVPAGSASADAARADTVRDAVAGR